MVRRHRLVEFDAEPRPLGRRHEARLHAWPPGYERLVKIALDRLDHQDVRTTDRKMHVGGPFDGPRVEMRRDLRARRLGQNGDLLGLPDPAGAAQGGLQNARAMGEGRCELGLGRQPLAGRHGHARRPRHLRQRREIVGRHGFLEPQRVMGLDRLRQPHGAAGDELTMRAEKKIRPVANRRADRFAEGRGQRDVPPPRHVPAADRVGPGRVELHRRPALGHPCGSGLARHLRIDPELVGIVMRLGIEIGIGPHLSVHPPAQKRPDRPVPRLAKDVPAGHFQPRKGPHHRRVGPLREARGIGPAEHQFDILGAFAFHVPGKDILHDGARRSHAQRARIDLAKPGDPVIGRQPHDLPVPPAPARRRRRDGEKLQLSQAHAHLPYRAARLRGGRLHGGPSAPAVAPRACAARRFAATPIAPGRPTLRDAVAARAVLAETGAPHSGRPPWTPLTSTT